MNAPASTAPLAAILREMGSVLVAFSGGVDSALLLAVAARELGTNAAAFTATSESLPEGEGEGAAQLAAQLGVRHIIEDSRELDREAYRANAGDRCYHCKTELFDLARAAAQREGFRWVADGTIVDDLSEIRPGLVAAREHEVRHPLLEAGMTKAAVRAAARDLGLTVWDKPAVACLGSRFAIGTRVSPERIEKVARVERALRGLGIGVFRVRIHDLGGPELARVEISASELDRLGDPGVRETLLAAGKSAGFAFVTLDLGGYQRGSSATPAGAA